MRVHDETSGISTKTRQREQHHTHDTATNFKTKLKKSSFKPTAHNLPPLAVKGKEDKTRYAVNDINQGNIGNCWYMSALASYVNKYSDAIEKGADIDSA